MPADTDSEEDDDVVGYGRESRNQWWDLMTTFLMNLVSPEKMLFAEQVDQVDLPGVEGDLGVLSGHAPIVTLLRPGIVTTMTGESRERFVVLGGLAEFSSEQLTILAESASSAEEFDLADFRVRIEDMEKELAQKPTGDELDRAIELLDRYKSIHTELSPATAF